MRIRNGGAIHTLGSATQFLVGVWGTSVCEEVHLNIFKEEEGHHCNAACAATSPSRLRGQSRPTATALCCIGRGRVW